MASPNAADDDTYPIDPAEPLRGIIVCCTSIPTDQRSSIAQKVAELGGVHKYDLTPDVTHLIVGEYDTPKYRHVARERSDIKAMDAGWIEALAELWKNDDEFDFWELEKEYQLKPLEKRGVVPSLHGEQPAPRDSLLICLTGFGDQRDEIAQSIEVNGGRYTGDLTRKCTHLVVNKPEGKKYVAAKSWGIYAVTLEWLTQSIARGMILEEAKFDPLLPPEEQGQGAWNKKDPKRISLGKRARSLAVNPTEEGPRKLRKTASMKLTSQRNNMWGDILNRSTSREYSFAHEQPQQDNELQHLEPQVLAPPEEQGVFANCYFFIHGFSDQRASVLEQTIFSLNGSICGSLEEAANGPAPKELSYRFLLVPQTSQPDTHPQVHYDNLNVVTEYYIEKCLHNKQFFDPNDNALGRPFPLFPIEGFSALTICSAAFTGIELNQVARSVAQLGAKFEEEFRKDTSVLVCKSLATIRKDKLRLALKWAVPAVSADWLWECISTGFNVPLNDFIFPELKNRYQQATPKPLPPAEKKSDAKQLQRTHSETVSRTSKPPVSKPSTHAGVDTTAFDHDSPEKPRHLNNASRVDSNISADFATARTHPAESFARDFDAPLAEVSAAHLNKSPSPAKRTEILPRTKSDPSSKALLTKTEALPRTKSDPTTKAASIKPLPPSFPPTASQPDFNLLKNIVQQAQHQQHQPEAPSDENNGPSEGEVKQAKEVAKKRAEEAKKQAKAAERQLLATKITSLITPTEPLATSHASHGPPRPRTRKLLGRAISNASNASSAASADFSVTKSAPDMQEEEESAPPSTQLEYRDPEAQEVKAALMSRMMGGTGEVKPVSSGRTIGGGRSMRRR
ncbi:Fc.00g001920.m01.CDS01 [Cosmosporella sp. VM-42]